MITPLFPHPAALLEAQKKRAVIIADLHIGWEMALVEKGIHVPTQTPRLLKKLLALIKDYQPQKLLILGDVKHTVAKAEMGEWQDIPDFFNELKKQVEEIIIIRGNHDGNLEPLLPETVKIQPATGITIGDIGFFHGHQWPSPTMLGCKTLVMGHLHPIVAFHDPAGFRISRQVWIKADCNSRALTKVLLEKHGIKAEKTPEEALKKHFKISARTMQLFVMPSFNDFLGGRPLNEKRLDKAKIETLGPVLRSQAVNIEDAETYLLDGTFLGTLKQLKALN